MGSPIFPCTPFKKSNLCNMSVSAMPSVMRCALLIWNAAISRSIGSSRLPREEQSVAKDALLKEAQNFDFSADQSVAKDASNAHQIREKGVAGPETSVLSSKMRRTPTANFMAVKKLVFMGTNINVLSAMMKLNTTSLSQTLCK